MLNKNWILPKMSQIKQQFYFKIQQEKEVQCFLIDSKKERYMLRSKGFTYDTRLISPTDTRLILNYFVN